MPITWLDIIVLVFMLVSGLLALARGFTREVFSIISWAAAAVAALMLFPRYQDVARSYLQPNWLADIALIVGIFLIVLIVVSFITIRVGDKVLDSRIGALDRTLGFLFGVARGLVLVVIGYLFFSWLVPPEGQPNWVREAKSKPLLDYTGETILALLPDDPEATLSNLKPENLGIGTERNDGSAGAESGAPEGEGGQNDLGYENSERQRLDQLLETTRGSEQR
jgi:membrane protein required for colicin V production